MIAVYFYDYGCGFLDVEKELGIDCDADDFLIRRVPGIRLEATDNQNDMEDNVWYLFSSANEMESARMIERVLKEKLSGDSTMHYILRVGEGI